MWNRGIISGRQHAFRKRHSFETQLTMVINNLAKILDNKRRVDYSYHNNQIFD